MIPKPYALSTKAVVRDAQGYCLLLRRSAASRNHAGLWEFPGGKVEPGESPDEGLRREVVEETGLLIIIRRVIGAAESDLPDRKVAYLFFEALASTSHVRLGPEHDAYEWLAPARLQEKALCPQFRSLAQALGDQAAEEALASAR